MSNTIEYIDKKNNVIIILFVLEIILTFFITIIKWDEIKRLYKMMGEKNILIIVISILLSVVLCLLLHEIGHVIFAKIYNCKVIKLGFEFKRGLPLAYTRIDFKNANYLQKIIIYYSGMFVNITTYLIVLFLFEKIQYKFYTGFFMMINILCYISNLIPFSDSDIRKIFMILKMEREQTR